ncbi:MAG: TldD/PmbA family protein [Candidatus Delongbacteria bacterium]|nr:TldD/PmbA family protein [Candidatus Delongbacteria bacterium]
MEYRELMDYCIEQLKLKGADKSRILLNQEEKRELYFNAGIIKMFRTTFNTTLTLTAIKDNKKGSKVLNKTDKGSLDLAIEETIALAESSEPDEAHDISEDQPAESFESGIMDPDNDKMYVKLNEFLTHVKEAYPITHFEEGGVSFNKNSIYLKNSNGMDYSSDQGYYQFVTMFTSKEGKKTSSFNYSAKIMNNLDEKFIDIVNLKTLLKQSTEEVDAKAFDQKFEGDIIVTPECMGDMIGPILGHLSDYSHITGVSKLKDKLGEKIASDKFTLRSESLGGEFAVKSFFSGDGYKNENVNIIENGVLKSFLLTLYGSKKVGKDRAKTDGANMSIDPGDIKFADMVKNTKKGILLSRFSGGQPNDNGDFSGIAKNSYYIEDGEIKYPVKEIMISGNMFKFLNDIVEISEEVTDFGYTKFPWMKVKDIMISGK